MEEFLCKKTIYPLRVLIVDDEPDTVLSISILLQIYGYEVLTAGNGLAALDLIAIEQPHVVVLDLAMPGFSGIALAKSIRETAVYRRPFLIAHTGMRDPYTVEEVRKVGIDMLMYKPAPFDALRDVLDRFAPLIEENAFDPGETISSTAVDTRAAPNGMGASGLTVQVAAVPSTTAIHCCLCDRAWEVQCVQVELRDHQQKLGVVCPACLRLRPGYLADQMKEEAEALASRFNRLHDCMAVPFKSPTIPTDPAVIHSAMAQLRFHSDRLRNQCREIRQRSTQLRAVSEKSRREIVKMHERHKQLELESRRLSARDECLVQPAFTRELAEAVAQFEAILILADQFKKLDHWSVSLSELIQKERMCMTQRFPSLDASEVRLLVDERYDGFLRSLA
jgi:CheY-like chemotaxis protein